MVGFGDLRVGHGQAAEAFIGSAQDVGAFKAGGFVVSFLYNLVKELAFVVGERDAIEFVAHDRRG